MNLNSDLIGVLAPPSGAASIVKRRMKQRGLNASAAAKAIGVDQSTLSRFFSGSELSIKLAQKLNKGLDLDIDMLFNLEAQKKAYAAKNLKAA
jgi:plasmid maintenance system antidote protein VapI